jgi:hypothetical protein
MFVWFIFNLSSFGVFPPLLDYDVSQYKIEHLTGKVVGMRPRDCPAGRHNTTKRWQAVRYDVVVRRFGEKKQCDGKGGAGR